MEDPDTDLEETLLFDENAVSEGVSHQYSQLSSQRVASAMTGENDNESDDEAFFLEEVDELSSRMRETGLQIPQRASIDSNAASEIGSLKHISSSQRSIRAFCSTGDLLAASLPVFGFVGNTQVLTHYDEDEQIAAANSAALGTSMPIRIPSSLRRNFSNPSMAQGKTAFGFIPPHLMDAEQTDLVGVSYGGTSPSAAIKREKLMARNAILRSTGFIEGSQELRLGAAAEVIDQVKESAMRQRDSPIRMPASTLTAALG